MDTGVGIPDHIQPKLFTDYSTFDDGKGSNKFGIQILKFLIMKIIYKWILLI